jgi:DNA-binding transcriptional regulator YiaG
MPLKLRPTGLGSGIDKDRSVRAAAISRALHPVPFAGREVRFMRRALDMTQKKFAAAMDLAPETISRWENDVPGHGAASEKLMRHNVCALLHTEAMTRDYDPAVIAKMKLEDGETPTFVMRIVRLKQHHEQSEAWDESQNVDAA